MPDPAELPPLLLPRPKSLRLLGGRVDPGARPPGLHVHPSPAGGEGEYRLGVTDRGVWVEAPDDAGRRHAFATLAQLRAQYGERPPRLEVHDFPSFPRRGFMLDVSRDRVPTNGHLDRLAAVLHALKFNHAQLYTEHAFAYAGHEEVWAGCSPITPDEARAFDAACRRRGIVLAANQNCFGHLTRWLRLPRYAPLAETHGEWMFMEWPRRGPFSLCPLDPRSLPFVEGLLDQLLPCFSGGLVNIGCDETFDVGQGRSREEVARRGRAAVSFDFVRGVADAARRRGSRPMFWADIALHHPECVELIPPDMIALAWGYEPDAPFGRWVDLLRRAGRETWVCPGTSAWLSITGRTTERRANIGGAGLRAGQADGFLLTEWGDMGHRQQWPVTLRALADGAEAAWNGAPLADDRAASLHLFGDRTLRVAAWLDELGDADAALRAACGRPAPDGAPTPLRNASALFRDFHTPLAEPFPNDPPAARDPAAWRAVLRRIEELSQAVPLAACPPAPPRAPPEERPPVDADAPLPPSPAVPDAPDLLLAEIAHTLGTARVAADRAVLRRAGLAHADRSRLASGLGAMIEEHRRLWRARAREGGLADSCAHDERVLAELRGAGP